MPFCLMFADDFTGACDTGLQFVRAGLRAVVALDPAGTPAQEADVLVVDTETRNCTRGEAARRLQAACAQAWGSPPRLVYKKVDSALRGNLAVEVRTVLEALGMDLCLMAPAFPEAGRITVGGYHLVHGVPVERSEVGRDPGAPVRGSFLPHLLDPEGALAIRTLGLEEIARGADHVRAMVEGMRGTGPTVIVLDAASDEDLRQIAEAAAGLSPAPLLCGSAGLAAQVPAAFGAGARAAGTPESGGAGPVLVVVGSAESATRRQVAALRAALGTPEWEVHAAMTAFAWERPHVGRVVEEVAARMERGENAVLSLVGLREGMDREEVGQAMRTLGQAVRRLADRVRPAGVVATGGWTAMEVVRALGGRGAEILDGVGAGVPVCRIQGGPFEGLRAVTKGGAIGDTEALVRAVRRLRAESPRAGGRPVLGITMGDSCGIGPEIVAKALAHPEVYGFCRPLVIGHPEVLAADLKYAGRPLSIREVEAPEAGAYTWGTVDVLSPTAVDLSKLKTGRVCPEAGRAAAEWVLKAIELAMAGKIGGVVTAPLNKEAMNQAGFHYAGHTELLAERTGTERYRLMLASERLNVVHATGHIALHAVREHLTEARVFDSIELLRGALLEMDRPRARIAVCGVNPHAGESGLFGQEDAEVIRPAVARARAQGWDVTGPLPADTVFFKAYNGSFDGVVAMYHDQGHAPVKLVAFDRAVNVTLGLPIVRTSVDHGTAFDIAGRGIADEGNLIRALRLGAKLAEKRAIPSPR